MEVCQPIRRNHPQPSKDGWGFIDRIEIPQRSGPPPRAIV